MLILYDYIISILIQMDNNTIYDINENLKSINNLLEET